MSLLSNVKKQLKPFMLSNGFKISRNCFYKIIDNLAFCVRLDQPSGLLYCSYYIIPLYIYSEHHYLCFGNRLEYCRNEHLIPLLKGSGEIEITAWTDRVMNLLQLDIFPVFDSIIDAKTLLKLLEQGELRRFFHCSNNTIQKLRFYTACYIGDVTQIHDGYTDYTQSLLKVKGLRNDITEKEMNYAKDLFFLLVNPL